MSSKAMRYRSEPLRSLHHLATDLHGAGLVTKTTMRRFDESCLTRVEELTPDDIKRIREKAAMSQTTFARALNVTPGLVSKWERGDKSPSGPSLKLLTLVDKKGVGTIL